MIQGALQTLNEEACEDVLEEIEEEVPQTSLIPPSPEQVQGENISLNIPAFTLGTTKSEVDMEYKLTGHRSRIGYEGTRSTRSSATSVKIEGNESKQKKKKDKNSDDSEDSDT